MKKNFFFILLVGTFIFTLNFSSKVFSQSDPTIELSLTVTDVACFGMHTGSIDLTIVSGGTAPYTYEWSNEATTQDLSGIAAGYYQVEVRDVEDNWGVIEIMVNETEPMELSLSAYTYSNDFNTSCHFCDDGEIDLSVSGGTEPYDFLWTDGDLSQSRTNLSARPYQVIVTDANGCQQTSETVSLVAPERDDWRMSGNAGTSPSSEFIGTTDSTDLVFRSNNSEGMRLLANGKLKIKKLESATAGLDLVFADQNGVLQTVSTNCLSPVKYFPWIIGSNTFSNSSAQTIGPCTNNDFVLLANNLEGLRIRYDASATFCKVVIGAGLSLNTATNSTYDYGLYVGRGILTEKVKVAISTSGDWSDKVFYKGYKLMPLTELKSYIKINKHLPEIPSAEEVVANGIDLAEMDAKLLLKIEELTLYIIKLEEEIQAFKSSQK